MDSGDPPLSFFRSLTLQTRKTKLVDKLGTHAQSRPNAASILNFLHVLNHFPSMRSILVRLPVTPRSHSAAPAAVLIHVVLLLSLLLRWLWRLLLLLLLHVVRLHSPGLLVR